MDGTAKGKNEKKTSLIKLTTLICLLIDVGKYRDDFLQFLFIHCALDNA
jgi:hypothetical protein